jgi:carbonic anhydrase
LAQALPVVARLPPDLRLARPDPQCAGRAADNEGGAPPMIHPVSVALVVFALAAAPWPVFGREEARTAAREAQPAPAPARARAGAGRPDDAASIEKLRERLSDKLGAVRAPDAPSPNVLRVTSRVNAAAVSPALAPGAREAAGRHRGSVGSSGGAGHLPHWAYSGETGPQAWGGLRPEFARCGNGTRQSPIDIRDGIAVDLEPVQFDYRATPFSVIDNGHTVQVDLRAGNALQVGGRRYELVQFHFHRPSEERVAGRQFEMSAHLVHRDPEGRLAVVALLLDRGAPAPVVQQVWNNLPLERHEAAAGIGAIDLGALLPKDRRYYTYMGSLTTPPCTEGVLWIVMQQPVPVSAEQIDIFARLYPMNARPVQAASGRLIKQSN